MFTLPNKTKVLNLPEQVELNKEHIEANETAIKQNTSDISNHNQFITSVTNDLTAIHNDINNINSPDGTITTGTLDVEKKATFGSDAEVDGKLIVNSVDDITDKDGNLIVKNESLDEFKKTLLKDYMVDRYSNHIFFAPQDANKVTLPVPSVVSLGLCTDWTDCYATCQFQGNYGSVFRNGSVHFALPASMAGVTINSNRMFGHWSKSVQEIEEENFDFVFDSDCRMTGLFTFWGSDRVKTVQVAEGKKVKFVQYMTLPFYKCTNLTEIGAIDLSEVAHPYTTPFRGLTLLKSIHMTHFKFSFDISSSTKFETADLAEIISNLDTVTTAQTLTMGSVNLAKLTQDQILVATGKGWTLA